MIAILVSFSALLMATGTDRPANGNNQEIQQEIKKSVKIHLLDAIQNPGLLEQMYLQINEGSFIGNQTENMLIAVVVYNNTNYYIYGTISEWQSLLGLDL